MYQRNHGNHISLTVPDGVNNGLLKIGRGYGSSLHKVLSAILVLGLTVILVNLYWLRQMQTEHMQMHPTKILNEGNKAPVVWVHAKNIESGYLQHVFNVFHRAGYFSGTRGSKWDVLWAHDYPFVQLQQDMQNLKPYQRVNKFPGSGFITNKVSLATSDIRFIPKAFKIPDQKKEFLHYSKEHPKLMWVQKSNHHRGIKILPIDKLDLNSKGTFIQQYVDDPFLVDGRRFDIGIYTVLTSIDPLRVYIYDGDWLLRFCPEKYYPFNPDNKDKYVVGDEYLPIWRLPSLEKIYTSKSYTNKETLLHYLRINHYNVEKLSNDIHAAIRGVYLNKEQNLITSSHKYPSKRNFFELVRFDFVLDKDLNIYLMEVNMSPNLSSKHFPPNKLLYEQVVFGMLSLVGVARSVTSGVQHGVHYGMDTSLDEMNMQVSDRDIQVNVDVCASAKCEDSCFPNECKLCHSCLTAEQRAVLKSAYLEHISRREFRRVFPPSFSSQAEAAHWTTKDEEKHEYNAQNRFMLNWFRAKCVQDLTWCL